jgi:hypothetical protein
MIYAFSLNSRRSGPLHSSSRLSPDSDKLDFGTDWNSVGAGI